MNKSLWPNIVLWLGIPALFVAFGGVTYLIVDSKYFDGFFPTESYWMVAIALHVALGLGWFVYTNGAHRRLLAIGYLVAMTAILLGLQGAVSCFSGDCF